MQRQEMQHKEFVDSMQTVHSQELLSQEPCSLPGICEDFKLSGNDYVSSDSSKVLLELLVMV